MKILLVHPQMSFCGGAEIVVIQLALELKKLGQDVSILSLSASDEIKNRCAGIPFLLPSRCEAFILHHKNFMSSLIGFLRQVIQLAVLIKKHMNEFEIIHMHNFPATWACALAGVRDAVWMCNEPPDSWNSLSRSPLHALLNSVGAYMDGYLVRRTAKRICCADRINADRIEKRYRHRVDIVPYGIDFDFFSRPPVDKQGILHKYGLSGRFVITQVGTVTAQKNQMESIKALFSVKKVLPHACLVFAGPENQNYRRELDLFIEAHDLKDSVVFLGPLASEDVAALYHISHIALFPVKTQGGWLAPFEALCAGTPIIVSKTMGAADLVKSFDLGIATIDYAAAVMEIYQNRQSYAEKTDVARAWVRKNLTWENFAKENLRIFTEVCQNKKGVV
ncbi:MAG: glycosyltransferase family 4 protein [Candidatus Omnitrophota bacterium]|jgi:glycosyltransferase involved in cell wall biosynthesis